MYHPGGGKLLTVASDLRDVEGTIFFLVTDKISVTAFGEGDIYVYDIFWGDGGEFEYGYG